MRTKLALMICGGFIAVAICLIGVALLRRTPAPIDQIRLGYVQLALNRYFEEHRHFPAAVVSEKGKLPYSWRVAILPYLGYESLYKQYHFDEPWDSPANRRLIPSIPKDYGSWANSHSGFTNVVVVVDEESAFPPGRHITDDDITDPKSDTIIAVQVPNTDIPWTQPRDISFTEFVNAVRSTQSGSHGNRVRFETDWGYSSGECKGDESDVLLRALITINGHDDATPFFRGDN